MNEVLREKLQGFNAHNMSTRVRVMCSFYPRH